LSNDLHCSPQLTVTVPVPRRLHIRFDTYPFDTLTARRSKVGLREAKDPMPRQFELGGRKHRPCRPLSDQSREMQLPEHRGERFCRATAPLVDEQDDATAIASRDSTA